MPIVEMLGITKAFGDLVASDNVSFILEKGEIHALLGENGAGKTTLMRILYGLYKADSGKIIIDGKEVEIHSPKDAIANGIGMVTQHFALVPPMTVAENVVLGYTDGFVVSKADIEKKVNDAAKRFGIEIKADEYVKNLSVGQRQRVEILKALYRNAKVLILDEPTAVLVPQEVDALFATLNRLKADGLSVIFISHKLHEITEITDKVTILRDGKYVTTVNTKGMSQGQIAALMVGRESFGVKREVCDDCGPNKVFELVGVSAKNNQGLPAVRNVNLHILEKEILGLAGVSGNGQRELGEVVCGVRKITDGKIVLAGKDLANHEIEEYTNAGMGRLPEDRHEGMVGELTVTQNLALDGLKNFTKKGLLDFKKLGTNSENLIKQFQIKAKPNDAVRTLSGGNMQKVLLARALTGDPKLVVAPQPTRGLDVGATDYVRQQLLEEKNRGAGV
ncbi:MAG TPA: ABC transporter ATP-binding protein, partial [Bellilinea sp.]|nr:ABC transporter ATP-binding protein [Bellilinea sp.]